MLRIQRFKLNEKEIKELLLMLRYKFISHEEILKASKVSFFGKNCSGGGDAAVSRYPHGGPFG